MKNLYITIFYFITSIFMVNAQNTCSPLFTNGILAYYPFCGDANDQSGNGANGLVNGATLTTDRFGNANSAYSFDGMNSYISIPYLTSQTVNTFSVSIWLINFQANGGIHAFYHGASAGEWSIYNSGMGVHLSDGTWYWANGNVVDSAWTHLVAIYNMGSNITVYLNGQMAYQTALPNLNLFYASGYFSTIGAYNNGNSNFWDGKIDDAYVYDRELTLTEIDSLYHQGGWVGMDEVNDKGLFSIYPNLNEGKFIVSCTNIFENPVIKILNALGVEVYTSSITDTETKIDLSNEAKGIYFVQVTSGKRSWTEKIVIK